MSNAMTVAPGTMEPASGRWPAIVGACSSATVNDHVSAGEALPARSEARAEMVWTPNPSGVPGRYENRPSTNAPAAETSLPSIDDGDRGGIDADPVIRDLERDRRGAVGAR